MNRFRFKACIKCRGDLVLDEGDWLCLQCGTYYYTGLYRKPPSADQPKQIVFPDHQEKSVASRWLSVGHGAGGEPSFITPEISEPIS